MKALVFGSMNIDRVYTLKSLPEKGETLYCEKHEIHVGGKGLNQSLSLSLAGMDVYMAGCIGSDGKFLTDYLSSKGVDTSLVKTVDGFTGHAVIEVDSRGQNQMILYPGANHRIDREYADSVLDNFGRGDLILMQYETSCADYIMTRAHEKGMIIAFNPSPYTDEIKKLPLKYVNYLILNEFEGQSLSGKTGTDDVLNGLCGLSENVKIVLTLGGKGAVYADKKETAKAGIFDVKVVDTTGAGDTFTGYFLASALGGLTPAQALRTASAASSIAVTKPGAAETIPSKKEVEDFLNKQI